MISREERSEGSEKERVLAFGKPIGEPPRESVELNVREKENPVILAVVRVVAPSG